MRPDGTDGERVRKRRKHPWRNIDHMNEGPLVVGKVRCKEGSCSEFLRL